MKYCRVLVSCIFCAVIIQAAWAIRCNRKPEGIYTSKSTDSKFQLVISGNPDKYVPGGTYTVSLRGLRHGRYRPTFKKFMIVVEPESSEQSNGHQNVGVLHLVDDILTKYSSECPNAILHTSVITKSEVQVTWTAPPAGSGCVVFRATVVEDHTVWYMDDEALSLWLCEDIQEADNNQEEEISDCCTCDDAMYEMVFEGIWSQPTHPKDFPSNKWETSFSDLIGASHAANYRFWEHGSFASRGLRFLAEFGDTQMLENEIKRQNENFRTIIKARGLRYPNVTGKTYSVFRVDNKNHLMSFVSKIVPSPDWFVGVSGLNLCLKSCKWVQNKIINLYPWDAGTDRGISYNSPRSPASPQETVGRITTSYPNDEDSPFYDASGADMKPLAKLHLLRLMLYEKPCDGADDKSGPDADGETESAETAPECAVTRWTRWSPCSVSCGKGERYRQRSFMYKKKARAMGCAEALTERAECYGAHKSCGVDEEISCEVSEWSDWSSCSVTCGEGVQERTRQYRTRQEHRLCAGQPDAPALHETTTCNGEEESCDETSSENGNCPQMEWSAWSPCSASCGKGKSIRMLLSVEETGEDSGEYTEQTEDCPEAETIEEKDCFELPSCEINELLYREFCLSPLKEGSCHRNNSRWYFDADTKTCINFMYKGCYGNKNNFLTQEDCESTCLGEEREEDTTMDGPIGGFWPASQIFDSKITYGIQDSVLPTHSFETQTEPYTAVDGPVVDCVVGRWTRWSACSVSCGNGYKTRNRKIAIHPRNGGLACPKVFKRKKCRKPCGTEDEEEK